MKKSNFLIGTALGMVGGAYLYSYYTKHPIKIEMAKNKVKNAMKDLQ